MYRKRTSVVSPRQEIYDPLGCPFREFKDNELGLELWGLNPRGVAQKASKTTISVKASNIEHAWEDDQDQPLPPSVSGRLTGWVSPQELAGNWNASLVVSREAVGSDVNTMRSREVQLMYADVLQRSAFCRKFLSCCYILERVDNFVVEHQWENFSCSTGPTGWLARLHILSPGMKPGGGAQHKPTLSKNGYDHEFPFPFDLVEITSAKAFRIGCYLVRLYYLGAWRCIWIGDAVPVDKNMVPLLPFAPALPKSPQPTAKNVKIQKMVQHAVVQLWPLLLCKALLKLAAINAFEESYNDDDDDEEVFSNLDIMHCLTGALSVHHIFSDSNWLWTFLTKEVDVFSWEETGKDLNQRFQKDIKPVRSKNAKKQQPVRSSARKSIVSLTLEDTLGVPSYVLPSLTPAYELYLLAIMIRDLPLIKPKDEPEVELWKTYRWVDWARRHGLYDEYECPRKKWIKSMGLLRLSRAPHMLDVKSTESISANTAKETERSKRPSAAPAPSASKKSTLSFIPGHTKESMEWVDFESLCQYISLVSVVYLPSMHEYCAAGSAPCTRISTKTAQTKITDLQAPNNAPLYIQVDSVEAIVFYVSLSTLHPNILANCGNTLNDYVRPCQLLLEKFDWLTDTKGWINAAAYLETRSYASVSVVAPPGRHTYRLWVNSALTWHFSAVSQSPLNLCKRSTAFGLAVQELPWATKKLSTIAFAFGNWLKAMPVRNKELARQFYESYSPDLEWNLDMVGYSKIHRHENFRRALKKFLQSRLSQVNFDLACLTLRDVLLDPYFGITEPPEPFQFQNYLNSCLKCKCLLNESVASENAEEGVTSKTESTEIESQLGPLIDINGIQDSFRVIEEIVCHDICTDGINSKFLLAVIDDLASKNEAAIKIQSNWRRVRCQRMLKGSAISQDVIKMILEEISSHRGMSSLMNIFFKLYPGNRSAYSLTTGIGARYGHQQYTGVITTTSRDMWIPLFITTFYCHAPVRVHFDFECSLRKRTIIIYDNDSKAKVPLVLPSELCYDFNPNISGYEIHGHSWRAPAVYQVEDIQWNLTMLTSEERAFHACDNGIPICEELQLTDAYKMHFDEIFIPNKRVFLAGVRLLVTLPSSISIYAKVNCSQLNIEVVIREKDCTEEILRCSGRGELFWSPVVLEGQPITFSETTLGQISGKYDRESSINPAMKKKPPGSASSKKSAKISRKSIPTLLPGQEAKVYEIEVLAPEGWPLTLSQWMRVEEVWNPPSPTEVIGTGSVPTKKLKYVTDELEANRPLPSDASCILEVSASPDSEVCIERNNIPELSWNALLNSWDNGPRHVQGAAFREQFRNKYLIVPMTDAVPSTSRSQENMGSKTSLKSYEKLKVVEETYLTRPEQLFENFLPLEFVSLCIKEELPDKVAITPEAADEAHNKLLESIEAAVRSSDELNQYNELVLADQRTRNKLLEKKVFVNGGFQHNLMQALAMRDEATRSNVSPPRKMSLSSAKRKKK